MSKEAQVKQLTDYMAKFIAYTAKKLPDDVIAKLQELRDKEDSPLSKTIYNTMFENQKLAVELNRPSGVLKKLITDEQREFPVVVFVASDDYWVEKFDVDYFAYLVGYYAHIKRITTEELAEP